MFNNITGNLKEKLKEHIYLLLALNIILNVMVIMYSGNSSNVKLVLVNSNEKTSNKESLKKIICKKAFYSLRSQNVSDYYIHPDIIKYIKNSEDQDFKFENVEKFYFSFKSREVCKVVAKINEGYIAYSAVVSENGPLFFRVTSIESSKPTFNDIKEYL